MVKMCKRRRLINLNVTEVLTPYHSCCLSIWKRIQTSKLKFKKKYCSKGSNGSFTLTESDSGIQSDSESKPNGYIVRYRTCSHCTDSDFNPYLLFLCRTEVWVRVNTRVRLWQGKSAITRSFLLLVQKRTRRTTTGTTPLEPGTTEQSATNTTIGNTNANTQPAQLAPGCAPVPVPVPTHAPRLPLFHMTGKEVDTVDPLQTLNTSRFRRI